MNPLLQLMHDTMNPVSAIVGATELLKRNDCSEEEREAYLDIITNRCELLNKVLDNFYINNKDNYDSQKTTKQEN